jgi:hypothetical protein
MVDTFAIPNGERKGLQMDEGEAGGSNIVAAIMPSLTIIVGVVCFRYLY